MIYSGPFYITPSTPSLHYVLQSFHMTKFSLPFLIEDTEFSSL